MSEETGFQQQSPAVAIEREVVGVDASTMRSLPSQNELPISLQRKRACRPFARAPFRGRRFEFRIEIGANHHGGATCNVQLPSTSRQLCPSLSRALSLSKESEGHFSSSPYYAVAARSMEG